MVMCNIISSQLFYKRCDEHAKRQKKAAELGPDTNGLFEKNEWGSPLCFSTILLGKDCSKYIYYFAVLQWNPLCWNIVSLNSAVTANYILEAWLQFLIWHVFFSWTRTLFSSGERMLFYGPWALKPLKLNIFISSLGNFERDIWKVSKFSRLHRIFLTFFDSTIFTFFETDCILISILRKASTLDTVLGKPRVVMINSLSSSSWNHLCSKKKLFDVL